MSVTFFGLQYVSDYILLIYIGDHKNSHSLSNFLPRQSFFKLKELL